VFTHRLGRDVTVLNDCLPIPGMGFLTVKAFLLHAAEPVVVDTGLSLPDRGLHGRARFRRRYRPTCGGSG
jgi:hypothetical protein